MTNKNIIIPTEYHDYIYRLTYYLLTPVAPLIPAKIKPNQITILAFLFAMLGSVFLIVDHTHSAYLYWVLFNFIWFLLDALDGMHARLTNQQSEYGAFLDHALDNIYFIFMLTAFTIRFDLLHVLYIYIIILRVTAALMVFLVQMHTKQLYLSRLSGGLEFLLFSAAMLLSFYYPNVNPAAWTTYPILLHWITALNLQNGFFMKVALWPYFFGVPITIFLQFRFVRACLISPGSSENEAIRVEINENLR